MMDFTAALPVAATAVELQCAALQMQMTGSS
jgi:hypothetical protein